MEGRQARRAKRIGVSEWCGCSSSRARIYIAAIYSIFIYIYYLYIYNINIISIYLIIYINIIPFSPFLCNTSVLYVKNSIYIYCKLLYINVLRVFPFFILASLPPGSYIPHPPGLPPHPPHPPFPLIFYFFYFSEVSHAAVLHFLLFSLLFPPYFKSRLFAHLFAFCHTFISFSCSY